MLWRLSKKWRDRRLEKMTAELNDLGVCFVELACDTVQLALPKGTVVDAFSAGVGSLALPDTGAEIIYSVSSYDIELHRLQDVRPAQAALGAGEELHPMPGEAPDPTGKDDYGRIHFVVAHDGPYGEYGGYLMRLNLHDGRYLRAVRMAVADEEDLETAHKPICEIGFATSSTSIDLDQTPPACQRAQAGPHFWMTLPPRWTVYMGDADEDDESAEDIVCVAPDERAFASVAVSSGTADAGAFSPELIDDISGRHLDMVSPYLEAEMSSPAIVLERTAERSLVRARDPMRDDDGHYTQLYSLLSVAPQHIVQVNIRLSTAGGKPTAPEWEAALDAFEPCLRASRTYHPRCYVVGHD